MTDGLVPKRQRFGNHDDLVFVLLLFATIRSWIKNLDESDNVANSKLDVNSIHSRRDLIDALHKLSPALVSRAGIFKDYCLGSVGGHHGDQGLET